MRPAKKWQVATKCSKLFFSVLFAFCSQFSVICHDLYYVFTTAKASASKAGAFGSKLNPRMPDRLCPLGFFNKLRGELSLPQVMDGTGGGGAGEGGDGGEALGLKFRWGFCLGHRGSFVRMAMVKNWRPELAPSRSLPKAFRCLLFPSIYLYLSCFLYKKHI